jgi:diguanylate cyclase (GGDEF)-like protein
MQRVLIVDDSKTIEARLANAIKNKIGCEIIQAPNRQLCFERLNKYKTFDMAFLDLGLPDAPNGEVVDLVSKYDIPIVILTASQGKVDDKLTQTKGVIDYIVKDRAYAIEQATIVARRFMNNKNFRVLIVDDSKTFAYKIASICNRYNLKTDIVHSAQSALDFLQTNDVDVVFVDYIMPNMNGLELTAELRKKYSYEKMSIIAISGSGEKDVIPKFLKFGANDFILKDFTSEELIARLSSQLDMLEHYQTIQKQNKLDKLTSLYNREYFLNLCETKYHQDDFSLIYIDIQNFKDINLKYGLKYGDITLQIISKVIKEQFNQDDIISRFGNDSFLILTYDNNIEQKVDELLYTLQTYVIMIDKTTFSCSFAIGMSSNKNEDLSKMITSVISATETSKTKGKNKISIAKEL